MGGTGKREVVPENFELTNFAPNSETPFHSGKLQLYVVHPRWWFEIFFFIFTPILGEIIYFDEHIF